MGHSAVTHAVIGMLNDKVIAGVVARLSTRVDHWYCASLGGPRGMTGKYVADIVRRVTQEAIAPRAPAVASVAREVSRGHAHAAATRPVVPDDAAGKIGGRVVPRASAQTRRSEEHTSELQSLMRISYAVFCLKKKKSQPTRRHVTQKHHREN